MSESDPGCIDRRLWGREKETDVPNQERDMARPPVLFPLGATAYHWDATSALRATREVIEAASPDGPVRNQQVAEVVKACEVRATR
jgi:hypothetical protein